MYASEFFLPVNNGGSSHHDAHKFLKESLTYVGANPELNPKHIFYAEREKEQEEFGNSHGHIGHRISEQTGFLKGPIVLLTSEKKSSEDDSNKQNVDQKPDVNFEVSEANEGESVPNVSEEGSNGKETDKISENGINGTKKADERKVKSTKAPENDEKDVKAEEKPLVETYKKNEDVSRENPKPTYHRLATCLCTESFTRAESGYLHHKKPEEAQKAHAPEDLSKSELLSALEPVSGEAEEYRSKQVPGGHARSHDKRHGHSGRGGKYNKNGKG